jgi:type II pantothenate kinase
MIFGNKKFTHKLYVLLTARPWLVDGLDAWLDRLKGPPHKCAAIFVDNSGIDIILGIIPFARELLQRGTKVIISTYDTYFS